MNYLARLHNTPEFQKHVLYAFVKVTGSAAPKQSKQRSLLLTVLYGVQLGNELSVSSEAKSP